MFHPCRTCRSPAVAVLLLAAAPGPAQVPATKPSPKASRQVLERGAPPPADAAGLRRVLAAWAATADGGLMERIRLIDAFLAQHPQPEGHPERLTWQLRRADLTLHSGAPAAAEDRFAIVLEQAAGPAALDLIGRALYGLAQCRLLRGRREAAIAPLERIRRELPGTRYDQLARLALRPLRGAVAPTVGQTLPPLPAGRTVAGPPPVLPPDRATLWVFWHPDAPRHQIDRWLGVWQQAGGLPRAEPVLIVLRDNPGEGDPTQRDRELQQLLRRRGWTVRVQEHLGGFLAPAALELGIDHAPSALLVGPGGVLAQRDPTPRALRRALAIPGD